MRSASTVNSALAARLLFLISLFTRGSVATNTTSVQDGDTFLAIAASAGIPVESLEAANPGVIATGLYAGQIITIPASDEPTAGTLASNLASSTATAAALTTLVTSASPSVSSNTLPSGLSSTTPSVSVSGSSTMASSPTSTGASSLTMASSSTSTSISPSSAAITSTSSTPSPSSSPSVSAPSSTPSPSSSPSVSATSSTPSPSLSPSIASTSSSPPAAPSVPSTTSGTCMPTPTGKFVDVANVQSETVAFCAKYVGTSLDVVQNEPGGLINGDSQNANKNDGSKPDETGYNMTITATPGCSFANATISFPLPSSPNWNCTGLLLDTYTNCNNKGMGGSITAGCLVYSFLPDP